MAIEIIEYLVKHKNDRHRFYIDIKHLGSTKMQRYISFYVSVDNQIINLSSLIAGTLNEKYSLKLRAVSIRGCGSDVVYYTLCRLFEKLGYEDCSNWNICNSFQMI